MSRAFRRRTRRSAGRARRAPKGAATLRETEPQYRLLFERHPHPMWVFDTHTLRVLAVNDAAVAQYGYSRREFLTKSASDVHPVSEADHIRRMIESERSGDDTRHTWLHRRKSGDVFEADVQWNSVRFRRRRAQLVLAIDVSRRLQSERELTRHHAELERRHLARELHDEFGQTLTGLKLTLQTLARGDASDHGHRLAWAESLVDGLMRQTRELSGSLRPAVLDDLGLLPALLTHLDRFGAQTGVRVTFTHAGIEDRLPPDIETAAFRIVQEALTNVARHAGVAAARLWVRHDEHELCVIVEDDGRGIAPKAGAAPTSGLDGMRERATLVGGRFIVDAPESGGTRVTAILPL